MAGDTPYEAFVKFRDPLQKAFSCVNKDAHLWALGTNGYEPGQEHALVPDGGEPVQLFGPRRLGLRSLFRYRIVEAEGERGPWKVSTTGYYHALEDEGEQEILTYHWHPGGESAIDFPHLHIERGIGASLGEIHKYHIPTGRIALEDVLRLAVLEFKAEPIRADWADILDTTQEAYEAWRSWHGSGPS